MAGRDGRKGLAGNLKTESGGRDGAGLRACVVERHGNLYHTRGLRTRRQLGAYEQAVKHLHLRLHRTMFREGRTILLIVPGCTVEQRAADANGYESNADEKTFGARRTGALDLVHPRMRADS